MKKVSSAKFSQTKFYLTVDSIEVEVTEPTYRRALIDTLTSEDFSEIAWLVSEIQAHEAAEAETKNPKSADSGFLSSNEGKGILAETIDEINAVLDDDPEYYEWLEDRADAYFQQFDGISRF